MFNTFDYWNGIAQDHSYTFACTGLPKRWVKEKDFTSRSLAEKYMYKYIKKYHLDMKKVYDDKHIKTYVCNQGVKFYISRAY